MSNRAVLLQVAPLLKDRNGRGYRRQSCQTSKKQVTKTSKFGNHKREKGNAY